MKLFRLNETPQEVLIETPQKCLMKLFRVNETPQGVLNKTPQKVLNETLYT